VVDIDDLFQIVNYWGDHGGPVDVTPGCGGNGVVDIDDLHVVLNNWGSCSAPAGPPAEVWDCYVRCSGLELADFGFCLQKCVENLP
jgi:hypothetical protein